jgi:hypothetical protein
MLKAIDKKIWQIRLRCNANIILRQAGTILLTAGILAVLGILCEKLLALNIIYPLTAEMLGIFAGFALLAVLFLWYLKRPSRMQTCLLLDERLKFHERFSTTLAISNKSDSFADAARREVIEKVNNLNLRGHFPIRPSRRWIYAGSFWLLAFISAVFLPQKDLLGFLHNRNQQQQQTAAIQQAKADVNDVIKAIALAVRELADPNLAEAAAKLDQILDNAKPDDIKRQAIRQLSDMSEQLRNMQSSAAMDSLNMMQRMFQQLRGSPDTLMQQIQLALAQGNFSQASQMLNQLQNDLDQNKLSDQQKKDMAEQFQNLAKKLSELAQKNEAFEKELEKLGLDKELSKLDSKQLRQSLQQQGLPADKIEQLLNKVSASQMARNRMSALASAMAGAGTGGLGADELSQAMEQLDELDTLQQQIKLTEASLAEISRCIACLGEGMGEGIGYQGPFSEGDTNRSGPGTGGPGIGMGPRDSDTAGDISGKTTRVDNESKEGPVIASWYFKESQIKGQSVRDYSQVIQAGRDSAAEAITENEIPRKYEETIKKYFGQLEKAPVGTSGQEPNQ